MVLRLVCTRSLQEKANDFIFVLGTRRLKNSRSFHDGGARFPPLSMSHNPVSAAFLLLLARFITLWNELPL